ncbi:4-(cytidine 5'-diphospho)-2-C-methyl-D-erythritol kinase [Candidatus Pelagibacter sp.]|nr:4-(cytidine 5'-diphospho)-2-C-methyl-D-erythritol kinase [Candidatus Pelagibacter sp.]
MNYFKIKSYAKVNLALNVTGKNSRLHKVESIVGFVSLYDVILIKKIQSKKHIISFNGKYSKNIYKKNTISKLLKVLEKEKLLKGHKFEIKVNKYIPSKSGLGGGSMNAASILKYLIKKNFTNPSKRQLNLICKSIGSDVILGLNSTFTILKSNNQIKEFKNCKKFYVLITKPSFGCSTKEIYSGVKKFSKPKFNKPSKKMFSFDNLKKLNNSLETISLSKFPKLKKIKHFLEKSSKKSFVRMTGSGSAIVAYFKSKKLCDDVKKKFSRKYKNYWCKVAKTI